MKSCSTELFSLTAQGLVLPSPKKWRSSSAQTKPIDLFQKTLRLNVLLKFTGENCIYIQVACFQLSGDLASLSPTDWLTHSVMVHLLLTYVQRATLETFDQTPDKLLQSVRVSESKKEPDEKLEMKKQVMAAREQSWFCSTSKKLDLASVVTVLLPPLPYALFVGERRKEGTYKESKYFFCRYLLWKVRFKNEDSRVQIQTQIMMF